MRAKSSLTLFAALCGSFIFSFATLAGAETCTAASEMDAPTKSSIDSAARQMFGQMQQGDVFSLKQNSIPSLASNFGSIEQAIVSNKQRYSTANLMIKSDYLLDAP